MNTELPVEVQAEGWNNWGKTANETTAWFGEFGNTGPGASGSGRVAWAHRLTDAEARQFLPEEFLAGTDHWNPVVEAAGLP